jgi:hypothetical protein
MRNFVILTDCQVLSDNEILKNKYRILVEKPFRKRPLGRPGRRWEDNINIILRKAGCEHERLALELALLNIRFRLP